MANHPVDLKRHSRNVKATIWAPLLTGPVLIAVTAATGAIIFSSLMVERFSEIWKVALLVPVAVMWGFLWGWKILLISYPISVFATGCIAWQLDRVSSSVLKLQSPWIWWLIGAVSGLLTALVINVVIQIRAEGVWIFTRSGDGATLWRVCASLGCVTAGAATLALWRRIAHGRLSGIADSG